MRVLLIKLKHIGDSLLLTPTAAALRAHHPDAVIWVVVRQGCGGILAGCPAIDRVLTSAAPESENRSPLNWLEDIALVRQLRAQQFDYAFELSDNSRGRWLAWLSGAKTRCTDEGTRPLSGWWRGRFDQVSRLNWKQAHRVEKDFQTVNAVLPLGNTVPPLAFERDRARPWQDARLRPPWVVFHPGTRWIRKRWPAAHWIELGHRLAEKGLQIIISTGPDLDEVAQGVQLVDAIGPQAVSTAGRLPWDHLAWLLHEARLFVGVDTAAMHLAAACQCPTVAIFGPSRASAWGPWRVTHRIVGPPPESLSPETGEDLEELQKSLTEKVPFADVLAACEEMLTVK